MNYNKNKIIITSNSNRDFWFALGFFMFMAAVFIALIVVLLEAPVK